MQLTLIARLRLGFVLLGVALTVPLLFVIYSVNERVEAQRRLRHQVVAERIFDELERELTAVLELESERTSAAYDAYDTDVDAWAPFIVGYFKNRAGATELVAATQLHPTRRDRLLRALARWTHRESNVHGSLGEPQHMPPPSEPKGASRPSLAPARPAQKAPASKTSPEILRQLNRGQEQRSKGQKKKSESDPLRDFAY